MTRVLLFAACAMSALCIFLGCGRPMIAGPSAAPQYEAGRGVATDSSAGLRILEPCPYQWLAQIYRPQSSAGEAWLRATPACTGPIIFSVEAPATVTFSRRLAHVSGPAGQYMVTACADCDCTSCAVVLR